MSDDIEEIVDETGEVRRLGSLCPPDGFVSAFEQTFEDEKPVWTDEEIRRVITDPNRTPRRRVFAKEWIVNQGSWGSCNGHACALALSRARYLRGIQDKLILSGSWVYSLINSGGDNGSALEDGLKAIQKYGACPADLVKPSMIYPKLQPKNAKDEAAKHKGLACWRVATKQGFRTAVAAGFPVIVAVHAGSRFQKQNASGIVGVDSGNGNHACLVDDLLLLHGSEVFDLANSWGLNYGTEGRAYLTWDSFEQPFSRHTFFAIGSTSEIE